MMKTMEERVKELAAESMNQEIDITDDAPADETPENIQLTKEEMLRLENLALKEALLQTQAKEASKALRDQKDQVIAQIEKRLGQPLKGYSLDPNTGIGVYTNGKGPV